MTPRTDTSIVLTAAINVSSGTGAVEEAAVRRQQYLAALRFYTEFAPVYFLENSGYDLFGDADFTSLHGVRLRKIPAQDNEGLGKGYREFHSLDVWYESEKEPPARILKITGRYIFANIADILAECREAPPDVILFDRYKSDRMALTSIFSLSWTAYKRYLYGLFHEVNDPAGIWIEHVVYRALAERRANCWLFRHEPNIGGICGSTGQDMRGSRFKLFLRQATRNVNRLLDGQFLYLRGTSFSGAKEMLRERLRWRARMVSKPSTF